MKSLLSLQLPASVVLLLVISAGVRPFAFAQNTASIYHPSWTDLNKNGRRDIYEDSTVNIDRRVEDLLRQMNLDEKTCQTATLYGAGRVRSDDPAFKDEIPTPGWKKKIWKDGIANIDEHLNGWGPNGTSINSTDIRKHVEAMNAVQRFFIEETRLGIPVDFTNEGLRGVAFSTATSFPSQLGIGTTWDKQLVHEIGRITAVEARALGYTNIYAPTLDVPRDQRWGRVEDTFGEDPYLVARLGVAMAMGLQENKVASTVKHFAVYSNNKAGREGQARTDPQTSPREVENIFLPGFKAAIKEAGVLGVMSSYNDYDSIPITGSSYWLTDRLRKEFGFKGYVVSDSASVEFLYNKHGVATDMKDAVRQSINAGLNVKTNFTPPDDFIIPLRELVKEGKVTMNTLDDRVRDVLRVKFILGLFDHPYVTDIDSSEKVVNSPSISRSLCGRRERASFSSRMRTRSCRLARTKSNRSLLSAPTPTTIQTHNTGMARRRCEVLRYSKAYETSSAATRRSHMQKDVTSLTKTGRKARSCRLPVTEKEWAAIQEAVRSARSADAAVVVLGDQAATVGEHASRSSLDLPGRQELLLRSVVATGKPVILVLINGRPMTINWANKHTPGIIGTHFPGVHGGTAIADVLFGDYNPGGKLTITVPKTVGQIPFNFPTKPNAQAEGEKTRVQGALYYFGYGLSYTTFLYSNLKISPLKPSIVDNVTVSVDVQNSGMRAGDEVVQLYTRDLVSSVTTYEKNLRGFERIHLQPGEKKTVAFTLMPGDLSLWDRNMRFVVEPGVFRVMVGSSSEDIRLTGDFESVGQIKPKRRS
jgi:beta-glucosidase